MPSVKLESRDGEIFMVDLEIARQFGTIKTMLDDLGTDEDDDEAIPIPNVNGDTLEKVIEWVTYHKDDPPLPEYKMNQYRRPLYDDNGKTKIPELPPWNKEFFKVDKVTLYELILAANFLNIKGLLALGCQKMASMINGKNPEEIRKTFNIKEDLSSSEEEEIRKESEWVADSMEN